MATWTSWVELRVDDPWPYSLCGVFCRSASLVTTDYVSVAVQTFPAKIRKFPVVAHLSPEFRGGHPRTSSAIRETIKRDRLLPMVTAVEPVGPAHLACAACGGEAARACA